VPEGQALSDLCASFQATIVELLIRKTRMAAKQEGLAHVQLCGGVAANSGIRAGLRKAGEEDGFEVYVPRPIRCTDNAAMIAAAGSWRLAAGLRDSFDINADSGLPLPSGSGNGE
jgi:N6-L-threonylcarbamoyladenine synthase